MSAGLRTIDDHDGRLSYIRDILVASGQKQTSKNVSNKVDEADDVGEAVGKKT
uniref:Uncharacterized protein n=1 Tax=Arion vulgaris TaxID=1028688 RepID=A0A0B6ZKL9_9EUPU